MLRLLLLIAALAVSASPASAALIRYGMTFKASGGAVIGTGAFSSDPDVKQDIMIDAWTGGPCMPYTEECVVGAMWTPITPFFADIFGSSVGFHAPADFGTDTLLFAEGHWLWHGRYNIGGLGPGSWFVGDIYFGEFGLTMDTLAAAGEDHIGSFTANGPFGDAGGSVEFRLLPEIPVPAGLPLFMTGVAAILAVRRRRFAGRFRLNSSAIPASI